MSGRTIAERKTAERLKYLRLRRNMDKEAHHKYSRLILEHLIQWEVYRSAVTIHCFMSIRDQKEVDTDPILARMEEDGKRIVLPRSKAEGELEHVTWLSGNPLRVSRLGIREPAGGVKVPASGLDLVLVPLVAADPDKNRIGYGKGYYDRFLAQTKAVTAGLLFELSLSQKPLPVESHDQPLDYLITEKGIY